TKFRIGPIEEIGVGDRDAMSAEKWERRKKLGRSDFKYHLKDDGLFRAVMKTMTSLPAVRLCHRYALEQFKKDDAVFASFAADVCLGSWKPMSLFAAPPPEHLILTSFFCDWVLRESELKTRWNPYEYPFNNQLEAALVLAIARSAYEAPR
ncbi:MAG: hypothetical protein AAF517_19400, partial [Planctomycetota bacterium]